LTGTGTTWICSSRFNLKIWKLINRFQGSSHFCQLLESSIDVFYSSILFIPGKPWVFFLSSSRYCSTPIVKLSGPELTFLIIILNPWRAKTAQGISKDT